jgi:hypothetical protein
VDYVYFYASADAVINARIEFDPDDLYMTAGIFSSEWEYHTLTEGGTGVLELSLEVDNDHAGVFHLYLDDKYNIGNFSPYSVDIWTD